MHGAGNDFVLLDFRQSEDKVGPELARKLADRRLGVGCDQILVLRPSQNPECTARYEVINADGSTAGQCGNGVRCIALYLKTRGEFGAAHSDSEESFEGLLSLEGPSGVVRLKQCADGEFECAMGEPRFAPNAVPIDLDRTAQQAEARGGQETPNTHVLELKNTEVRVGTVSMGNPHAVMQVEDVASAPLETLGPQISCHPAFPEGSNAGFVEWVDRNNIRLRVHERGVGETLACGSGACAAVAVLASQGLVSKSVNVFLPGGHLVIKWNGPGHTMTMKGPASHVFRGTLDE